MSSCATFKDYNSKALFPTRTISTIEVRRLIGGDQKILAYSEIAEEKCVIYLRQYPKCLSHEVRHCYEGNWHEGTNSQLYC